jgi:hypothetical protein
MVGAGVARLLGVVAVAGVSISWVHFSSTVYPYTMSQPSSFRHVVLMNTAHVKVDYFSPSLGSAVTDVAVYAVPGSKRPDPDTYLRDENGTHIRAGGSIVIDGKKRSLTAADFSSFGNRWTVEQASFVENGMVWRLSLSYEPKYQKLRPVMVKMVQSFAVRGSTHRRAKR